MDQRRDQEWPQTLSSAAIGLHELYQSYIAAGFTVMQAFELVKVALAASISRPVQQ